MGDLTRFAASRDALKTPLVDAYPGIKAGAIPNNAGQLFRFVHEMKTDDLIVYPSKRDRQVHIGRIAGSYRYDRDLSESYPQQRPVKWLAHLPRTKFSQGALYEIGSALSFFRVKTYADEFQAAATGNPVAPPLAQDESVAAVAADIEDNTRDFVLKRLAEELKGLPLEEFVKHLLEAMGYHARLARKNEPSVDVIAHKDLLGIEPPIIKVQVKSSDSTATDKDVSALFGKLSSSEYGLFVTLGTFSPASRAFEQGKANLRLIDGQELVDMIFQHYERFDSRYKGILPLKRVYVPEALDDAE